MNTSDVVELLKDWRRENATSHDVIWKKLDGIDTRLRGQELFKAKIVGMAGGVAALISAGGWAIAHAMGG